MSSSLLTPDPGLIFWMLIAFGIVLFILSKYGFPVILKKLDSRKKFIDDSLVAAQQAFEELEQVKTKNEQLIERAKKEQMQIISEAAKKRDLILENAHEKAMKETSRMIENARKQLIQEKEEALTAIRREIAVVSVDIAEKVLRENLKRKEDQMSMIERLIDEINIS
ncbi:MAG: F0F1 ATP synthase subunit B [Dysgonamonadaceae bacterium]|jgi:F-type H+-transporting ATPase subunit b|nr:F0F1 ATP synthase subunit B [Dysgonamonadaceae bacterium]HUI33254.1 F0F1 ATP synthase subunit B [Dysgonamonadaceae bacterium]